MHLTAKLGWSSGLADIQPLVSSLRELLDAFHKGKGVSASFSVMGLSITRHSVLILNHLLAELQHLRVKVSVTIFSNIRMKVIFGVPQGS